ncbi:hypothetical protein RJD40_15490 [Vibrio scophthalmi]|uniref:hypothetical protein n=1 Tax=Vibrio scophthalmi TaxID=45658 RepID=UPI003AAE2F97
MDTDFEEAIRNIWHVTSLKMGENIFESRCIWGKDPDGAANFHPSQISANIPSEDSEISIGFRWEGKIQLLDFNYFDFNELKAGVMY